MMYRLVYREIKQIELKFFTTRDLQIKRESPVATTIFETK